MVGILWLYSAVSGQLHGAALFAAFTGHKCVRVRVFICLK